MADDRKYKFPIIYFLRATMKSLIKYSLLLFIYWFLVFFAHRLFFVIYQMPIGERIALKSDLYKSYIAGYKLDIATSTILLLLPMLLALLYIVFQKNIFRRAALIVLGVLLVINAATSIGDAGLYREWNAKINMQALSHFKNPAEVFHTLSPALLIAFFALLALFTFPFYYLYKRGIHALLQERVSSSKKNNLLMGLLFFILSNGVAILLIRGGITNIPINQSVAYFSNDVFANDIAVNPLYNLLQDATIKNDIPDASVYTHRSSEEARQLIVEDFKVEKDSTISILTTKRPNLVFIFLESWSTDNVSILGGVKGCTPQFDSLCKDGLLFTKAYSNAYVSDQGIPAVLSACPSVSRVAMINQPSKVPLLPCISEELLKEKYSLSFLFGGDLVYGNIRGYLLEKKFQHLVEQKDLTQYPSGRIGIHDEYCFAELLKQINQRKEPFLQCFFTTSTHMPYDHEAADDWQSEKNDPEKKYTESCHYSDLQLGKFMTEAKKQPWYANTLFVIIADHSHNSIKQWPGENANKSHIPLLFTGGALDEKWRGKTWDKIVSQLDIPSTLLHQMQMPSDRYVWSRNIFNPATPSSAYYVFFGGAGYINENGFVSQHQGSKIISHEVKDSTQINYMYDKAMSFQQLVYEGVKMLAR